jgi:hypothetical protein
MQNCISGFTNNSAKITKELKVKNCTRASPITLQNT